MNNWLHLQEINKPLKCFRTWKACANYIFENNLEDYFIVEEGTGIVLVRSGFKFSGATMRRAIVLDPEHLPPASVIPFL